MNFFIGIVNSFKLILKITFILGKKSMIQYPNKQISTEYLTIKVY